LKGNQQFLLQKYVDQLRFLTQPSAICFWTLWDGQIFAILAWPDFNVSGGRGAAAALGGVAGSATITSDLPGATSKTGWGLKKDSGGKKLYGK